MRSTRCEGRLSSDVRTSKMQHGAVINPHLADRPTCVGRTLTTHVFFQMSRAGTCVTSGSALNDAMHLLDAKSLYLCFHHISVLEESTIVRAVACG